MQQMVWASVWLQGTLPPHVQPLLSYPGECLTLLAEVSYFECQVKPIFRADIFQGNTDEDNF